MLDKEFASQRLSLLTSGLARRRWRRCAQLDKEFACLRLSPPSFGPGPEAVAEGRGAGREICFYAPLAAEAHSPCRFRVT